MLNALSVHPRLATAELFELMTTQRSVHHNGNDYRIMGVMLEDGSGKSFLVSLLSVTGKKIDVYYRCR